LGLHYAEPSREETSVTGETTGKKRAQTEATETSGRQTCASLDSAHGT